MAVASPGTHAPHAGPVPAPTRPPARRDPEWWVRPLTRAALVVWLVIPPVVYFYIYRPWSAHAVWSVIIAGLPLFIILVGYHRWRRICPLAFFSRIPVLLRRPGTRRASPWMDEHYYYVMFAFLAVGLWLRLTVINGVGEATAVFFVLISVAALIVGALFTGKTWCNYICPVSLIEKINTEPHGLRETSNSACVKCTACKKSCPDINEENGYWKEIDLRSKRFAYYAFPGLTLSFFLYFYLQAGTWDYYFLGGWADQPALLYRAFRPDGHPMSFGFFFFPEDPRWVAAALTLAAGAFASYALLSMAEPLVGRWLRRHQPEADAGQVRHLMFTIAAFAAFITFYAFAGQPLLRLVPWLGTLGGIGAAVVGTLFLARRYGRTQKAFAEQTVALNVIKRWEWPDMRPPKDLHEAFLIHTARSAERKTGYAQVLDVYQEAVREALADGLATREEVYRLEALRNQLQIKNADHEKIMASLAEEERLVLTDPSKQPSAEKRLQLETYKRALEQHLKLVLAADSKADDRFLTQLRKEYNVTEEEHTAALDALLGGTQGMAAQLSADLRVVARAVEAIRALKAEPSPPHELLADILQRKRIQVADRLVHILGLDPESEAGQAMHRMLCQEGEGFSDALFDELRAKVPRSVSEELLAVFKEDPARADGPIPLTEGLRMYTESADPYVRAAALYALAERGELDLAILHRLTEDEHELVRETLQGLTERLKSRGSDGAPKLTRIEKMIALRAVPIFSSLEPVSLAELARAGIEGYYAPGDVLVREGEQGDVVFIIVTGDVTVLHKADGGDDVVIDQPSVGDVIGEMAVLDPAPRSATLRAGAGGVRVLRLDGTSFRDALKADPGVASGVIRALAQRVRHLVSMATPRSST